MTKSQVVQLTRVERRCDNCLRVIPLGDMAYVRYHRRYPATYCLSCYESRREVWERPRGETEDIRKVLALLKEGPRSERELTDEVGTPVRSLVRRMERNGYPIGLLNPRSRRYGASEVILYRTDYPELLHTYLISRFGSRAKLLFASVFSTEQRQDPD